VVEVLVVDLVVHLAEAVSAVLAAVEVLAVEVQVVIGKIKIFDI
jgi:hypothetical protein